MKNLFLVFVAALTIISCQKQASDKLAPNVTQNLPEDETVVLKPKEGYNSSKRSNDFIEAQLKGKPPKNNLSNITDLRTEVISAFQIDLYFSGVRNATS